MNSTHIKILAAAAVGALTLAAVPADAQDAAQETTAPSASAEAGTQGRIFTPADFARFAPRNVSPILFVEERDRGFGRTARLSIKGSF